MVSLNEGAGSMSSFSGDDPASRAWRREQMGISNDISGLPRDAHVEAMVAALDALNLSDEDRIAKHPDAGLPMSQ